jgi:CheY-like chemotaxis protein
VEKHLLDKDWVRSLDLEDSVPQKSAEPLLPRPQEEGLLASLERLDSRVKSVAILEDDADAARLLRRIIQSRASYHIYEASNGREGLDMVRQQRPDLILLDLMMPEMDGFTVLSRLKESDETANIPVIVITAKELTAGERRRLSGNVESLLQKGSYTDLETLDDLLDGLV